MHDRLSIVKYNTSTMRKKKLNFYSTNPNIPDRPMNDRDLLNKMKSILQPIQNSWSKRRKERVRKY